MRPRSDRERRGTEQLPLPLAHDVLSSLRQHTRALHAEVERAVPILATQSGACEYRWYLAKLLGFHRTHERRLELAPRLAALDLPARRKVTYLERDLLALGVSPEQLATLPCSDCTPLTSEAGAYGVMYVLEGATLGGKVVYRSLHQRDPELMARASAYLRCYGEHTRARWNEFVAALIAAPRDELESAAIVAAARDTFAALLSWLTDARRESDLPPSIP
jgi:heme oxygenase